MERSSRQQSLWLQFFLTVLLLFVVANHLPLLRYPCYVVWSLSLDDSSSPKRLAHSLQRIHRQTMPGIWKLTTDSLPYEHDIRSRLDNRIASNESNAEKKNINNNNVNKPNSNNDDVAGATILLKLNQDGTFRQCDEGYQEGRWVAGRWKLKLLETNSGEKDESESDTTTVANDTNDDDDDDDDHLSHNRNEETMLLLLAMNRQYFGPPYDVLLEAATKITMIRTNNNNNNNNNEAAAEAEGVEMKVMPEHQHQNQIDDGSSLESYLKNWQGVVRKGKFIRSSPEKHPLDLDLDDSISSSSNTVATTNVLMDPESLGNFSLTQALAASSIDRKRRKNNVEDNSFQSTSNVDNSNDNESEKDNDGTFFSPYSSSDDGGVLQ